MASDSRGLDSARCGSRPRGNSPCGNRRPVRRCSPRFRPPRHRRFVAR